MIKPTVKRGLMLDFLPKKLITPDVIDMSRVKQLNKLDIKNDGLIVYEMSRELRVEDNWALFFARKMSEKYKKNILVFINPLRGNVSKVQKDFLAENLNILENNLKMMDLEYSFSPIDSEIAAYIVDFNPIDLRDEFAKNANYPVFEVDSHNIIPSRIISDKQEYSAATMRRKVYGLISKYFTGYPNKSSISNSLAEKKLNEFIELKLNRYEQLKNDPTKDFTSGLSHYLHFGLISSQRVAIKVIESSASRENKEVFLEELIVRKELSDNFCLYNKDYQDIKAAPQWAYETLLAHKNDLRAYCYSLEEFENSKTHEKFWNTMQMQLVKTGRMHGFLRMYWAKKILEWSNSPEEALKIAIKLNDTYAIDGIDPNGYVGILWSICGVHDRPFTNRLVSGKIRYMSLDGCKKKFDMETYIKG